MKVVCETLIMVILFIVTVVVINSRFYSSITLKHKKTEYKCSKFIKYTHRARAASTSIKNTVTTASNHKECFLY